MKKRLILAGFIINVHCLMPRLPTAYAADFSLLPGQNIWQKYLDAAPQTLTSFAEDPLGALRSFLPVSPMRFIAQTAAGYADVFVFLLVIVLLSFLLGDSRDSALLEVISAGGCGVLLWSDLVQLAQAICGKMLDWKNFMLGFLPVYGGVLTAGGEGNAGAASCGLLLSGLCFLAQGTALWVGPLLQSYLAISMACCVSTHKGLSDTCRLTGVFMQKGLRWTGRIFAVLLGLQRVVTVQLDRTALRLSRFLTGSVPVIGEALSSAAGALLAGMQLLKSSLGFAALAILGAEFVPMYLTLLLNLLFLHGCVLLCDAAENRRCRALFACLAEAVRCMAAITALFSELVLIGVAALMIAGGG